MASIKRFTSLYLVLSTITLQLLLPQVVHAANTASFLMTPTTTEVSQNSDVQLTITIAAGTSKITGAQACVAYDSSKLTLINTNTSSSGLAYTTPDDTNGCGQGEARINRFDVTPAEGNIPYAVLTFHVLQAGTTATVGFNNSKSYIKDNETYDTNGIDFANIMSGSSPSILTIKSVQNTETTASTSSGTGSGSSTSGTQAAQSSTYKAPTPALSASTGATLSQSTSSDVITPPSIKSTTPAKSVKTVAKTSNNNYKNALLIMLAVALVGTIVIVFFTKLPSMSFLSAFTTGKARTTQDQVISAPPSQQAPSVATVTPIDPAKNSASPYLSNIPDPSIPAPSTVVKPTEPPEHTNSSYSPKDTD